MFPRPSAGDDYDDGNIVFAALEDRPIILRLMDM